MYISGLNTFGSSEPPPAIKIKPNAISPSPTNIHWQRLESNQIQLNKSIRLQKHLEGNLQEVQTRHIYSNNIHHHSTLQTQTLLGLQGTPCKSIITGKNLFSLHGTPVLITGSLFSLQGFPCKPLYFPVRDCSVYNFLLRFTHLYDVLVSSFSFLLQTKLCGSPAMLSKCNLVLNYL